MSKQQVKIKWEGQKVEARFRSAAADALLVAAEYLLTESQAVVPLDESILQQSGTATVDERELSAAVAYDTPYAVRQHEDLTARHAPGRQAKYLEIPMHRERRTIGRIIATQTRRRIAALGGTP